MNIMCGVVLTGLVTDKRKFLVEQGVNAYAVTRFEQVTRNCGEYQMANGKVRSGDQSSRGCLDEVQSKLNVDEEYVKALRTKSFIEIWDKVHGDEKITTALLESKCSSSSPSSSFSPYAAGAYNYISDRLLEPRQCDLSDMFKTSRLHHLLIDFFDSNTEACRMCVLLLRGVARTRSNYNVIRKIIKISRNTASSSSSTNTNEQCQFMFTKLAFLPSSKTRFQLDKLRNQCRSILDRLTKTHRRIGRKLKFMRLCNKIWGLLFIVAFGALGAVTIVLGVHSLVGIVVAATPILLTINLHTFMSFFKCVFKTKCFGSRRRSNMNMKKIDGQLDAAAKGVFILNQDFGTMSRLATRLHDEIEHIKTISRLCFRNQKRQMLEEVVKEIGAHERCFLEQLDELEEHVYLCLMTINRARRLVLEQHS
ncbi:hypothetical protein Syun_005449 [Stephania yunnanensis]|uniref:Uncharacterized protein n=1 Tax=Stephania yunnanensis TaxID=152371 RepID=A0AAP0L4Q8_9MAGN